MEPNVQSMAAKADLLRVLADQSLSMDEKVRECTTTARRHHMGVASLGRIAQDVTSKELPETDVEGLVKHLVACNRRETWVEEYYVLYKECIEKTGYILKRGQKRCNS